MPPTRRSARESATDRVARRLRSVFANPVRAFQVSVGTLVLLVVVGTVGYMAIQDLGVLDALYMTIITLATVGYREVGELSPGGKAFTIVLIILGVVTAAWAAGNAVEMMFGRTFWTSVARRRMRELVMDLNDHFVVCGFGRLGRQITRDLEARGEPYVVVDWKEELEEDLLEKRIPHVVMDATTDEALEAAGIGKARGLVSALDSDASNVLTVLTARELNPDLLIVARANSESAESKLRRAGADRIVTPEAIGGHRLALALLRPAVHDLMGRIFTLGERPDIDVGQITVRPDSPFAGQSIRECDLRRVRNVSILAIRDGAGDFDLNPDAQRTIDEGDTLILIGPAEAIYELEALYGAEAA